MRCFVGPHRFVNILRNASWLSKMPHSGGFAPWRGLWPQIQTRPRFLCNAPTHQVSLSYVYSFGSYRVDTQTHKHTHKPTNKRKTSNVLRYATTLGTDIKQPVMASDHFIITDKPSSLPMWGQKNKDNNATDIWLAGIGWVVFEFVGWCTDLQSPAATHRHTVSHLLFNWAVIPRSPCIRLGEQVRGLLKALFDKNVTRRCGPIPQIDRSAGTTL